jgi:hypothetical protein
MVYILFDSILNLLRSRHCSWKYSVSSHCATWFVEAMLRAVHYLFLVLFKAALNHLIQRFIIITRVGIYSTSLEIKVPWREDRKIIPAMKACNDNLFEFLIYSFFYFLFFIASKWDRSIATSSKHFSKFAKEALALMFVFSLCGVDNAWARGHIRLNSFERFFIYN